MKQIDCEFPVTMKLIDNFVRYEIIVNFFWKKKNDSEVVLEATSKRTKYFPLRCSYW